ncbi:ubiquitin-activating enzyme, putative [Entamoeba histolytica HM-1:IMSS-B]|uniref:SUMO-activating enzyme subunit n=6 Tax=Entamoeba histolytica TaxID=5759 RepID=C4LXY4_ENTH1|nr:ubiquitin-activating enzyme, putative [Entamoeba histolytica HM-1:IMSS]EMD44906.1 ubiquitin activating enzyme, putative [Entamoeba histolytica KU27]EMH74544.1 ubiquitin-activating enzyme, putative [Entamoeba histolytica HM-1:IMSS-B]EMS14888.1 ubiquitin-activating enzyme [Entamoeba histolytica HM-3:IMSS]ENY63184.1 ubiquitin-activating enzyme, putative [Entamoeba histolytica HM-1:IMSS-A]GAT93640.1 ubiquitin-activating enzyme putative [Entamoeba histolytica]|eukprot:XP_656129.1 ubiquitin-activating enzyme, putative [Entamoeba histolytica HM-1:IMSS]
MSLSKEEIEKKRILVVGAGGIGCEVLKNILLIGFKHLEVIDLDVIDLSNLNRQFLFNKNHIGQPKSVIAAQVSKERYGPEAEIIAHHCEIQNNKFNIDYYKTFDIVINALDNLNARKHVNRMCVCANVPLIDGGTSGFIGQTTPIIPKETECYECQPKVPPKGYAVCTIRSNPSTAVHCVFWSKQLIQKLFGNADDGNYLNDFQFASTATRWKEVYDKVFTLDIKVLHQSEELWKLRKKPNIWTYEEIINCSDTSPLKEVKPFVKLYYKSFNILQKRYENKGPFEFEKDDDDMIDFITACTNIRCAIFNLQRISRFEVQEKAGNIIPAIPTTNSIISGLMIIEMMKVLSQNKTNLRICYLAKKPLKNHLLTFEKTSQPNKQCYICGNEVSEFICDLEVFTLKDIIDQITERCSLINPTVLKGDQLLYESGEDLEKEEVQMYEKVGKKKLIELGFKDGETILFKDDIKTMTFILKEENRKHDAIKEEIKDSKKHF